MAFSWSEVYLCTRMSPESQSNLFRDARGTVLATPVYLLLPLLGTSLPAETVTYELMDFSFGAW